MEYVSMPYRRSMQQAGSRVTEWDEMTACRSLPVEGATHTSSTTLHGLAVCEASDADWQPNTHILAVPLGL